MGSSKYVSPCLRHEQQPDSRSKLPAGKMYTDRQKEMKKHQDTESRIYPSAPPMVVASSGSRGNGKVLVKRRNFCDGLVLPPAIIFEPQFNLTRARMASWPLVLDCTFYLLMDSLKNGIYWSGVSGLALP